MNGEHTGLTRFVNQTQMASFSTFMGELRWTAVTFALATAAVWLLTRSSETMRATGLALAGMIATTLLGKSVAGVITNKNVRETSREYLEAKGKADAGAKENGVPAVHAEKIEKVEVTQAKGAPEFHDEHEWAEGDPRAGVL